MSLASDVWLGRPGRDRRRDQVPPYDVVGNFGEQAVVVPGEAAEAGEAQAQPGGPQTPQQGEVVGVGPGRRSESTGEVIPLDVKVGDSVVFVGDHSVEVSAQGQSLVMVPSGDVLAVVGL